MSDNRNLFAATRWVLKFCLVATALYFLLMIVAEGVAIYAWQSGAIAKGITTGKFALSMNLGRGHWSLGPGDITADAVAPIVLVMFAGAAVVVALMHIILRAASRIVACASAGEPFIAKNAADLGRIAWLLLGITVLQMLGPIEVYAVAPAAIRGKFVGVPFDIPFAGLLAVLLVFVLARIFRHGAEMRAELDDTV